MAPLRVLAVLHALPRIQDMAEDGLFVESLATAFVRTGPEAQQRLSEFLEKRSARLEQPARE